LHGCDSLLVFPAHNEALGLRQCLVQCEETAFQLEQDGQHEQAAALKRQALAKRQDEAAAKSTWSHQQVQLQDLQSSQSLLQELAVHLQCHRDLLEAQGLAQGAADQCFRSWQQTMHTSCDRKRAVRQAHAQVANGKEAQELGGASEYPQVRQRRAAEVQATQKAWQVQIAVSIAAEEAEQDHQASELQMQQHRDAVRSFRCYRACSRCLLTFRLEFSAR
jgi:hypothetical protein